MAVNGVTYLMLGLSGGIAVLGLAVALISNAAHERDRRHRDDG